MVTMIEQQPMTAEQIKAGLAAAQRIGKREHAMAFLAARYGMRESEIAKLRMSDLNLHERTVKINSGKHSIQTVEGLTQDVYDVLLAWLGEKPESDYVFPSQNKREGISRSQVWRIFCQIALNAGIPTTSRAPHAWRHSIGQKLADENVAIQTIARVLRHKSIESTKHYFKVTQRLADETKAKHLGW